MDPMQMFDGAHRTLAEVVGQMSADDLTQRTPCEAWTVRDETNKIVASLLHNSVALEEGRDATEYDLGTPPELIGNDPAGTLNAAIDRTRAAYAADGAMEKTVPAPVPGMELPAEQLFGVRILETTIVTWDLARSIGAQTEFPPEQVALAQQVADFVVPALQGAPDRQRFAPAPDLPADATDLDRLIASTGRNPSWPHT